jgi:hypothetical protein
MLGVGFYIDIKVLAHMQEWKLFHFEVKRVSMSILDVAF